MLSGDFDADGLLDEEWWGHVINDSRGSSHTLSGKQSCIKRRMLRKEDAGCAKPKLHQPFGASQLLG
jgi:hypothetical protein